MATPGNGRSILTGYVPNRFSTTVQLPELQACEYCLCHKKETTEWYTLAFESCKILLDKV
eukprot:3283448-Ditylum_brightwellii.AAC.1